MSITTPETLVVNGIPLNTYAYNIQTGTGREQTPGIRGTNVQVLGRSGQLYIPMKAVDIGVLTLNMFIIGAATSGTPGSTYVNQRTQYVANREALYTLFASNSSLLHFVQTMPDSTTRECFGEVLEAIAPTTVAGRTSSTFSVAVSIPGAYWQDTSTSTFTQSSAVSGTTYSMSQFAASTANIEDSVITITGPATNPSLTDVVSGVTVALAGSIPSAQTWVIDSGGFTSVVNSISQLVNTTHLGSPRLFVICPPAAGGSPSIILSGSGFTSATAIQVLARNKYVVA